jgi:3-phosphoshikimate 1-carboxyvinyltransferase
MAMIVRVRPCRHLHGSATVPGDKSISHRALLLGAISEGVSRVDGWLAAADCEATLDVVRSLGVTVEQPDPGRLVIHGRGLHGLRPPPDGATLDCRGSGTTMRLMAGILAGQPFAAVLDGHAGLRRRPMERVAEPLRRMGARVESRDGYPPLAITGGQLRGIDHTLPVASAQVKSAILLAALYAEGVTAVHQPGPARDHTERMLAARGVDVQTVDNTITLQPPYRPLRPCPLSVPADFSSAAFPLVAALLVPDSEVRLERIGVNPTRTGLLDVLRDMGARVEWLNRAEQGGEPVADLQVRFSSLRAHNVGGDTVVRMIDEFPIFVVAATQAEGETAVRDAGELRVKESDRIAAVSGELRKMGADIQERPDGFVLRGPRRLHGARVQSAGDHRLAMALVVAGLIATGETIVEGSEVIGDSFPGFAGLMQGLGADLGEAGEA